MSADILIVDDEADIRTLIKGILDDEGYSTRLAEHSTQAYERIEEKQPDLIVLDIWLQGSAQDGLEILQTVKEQMPEVPVIMISGHGTIETAVSAIKEGAYDFIEKPFKADRLLLMIQRALETAALRRENQALRQQGDAGDVEFVAEASSSQELKQVIGRVAQTNSRVLLTGEAGVGKDVAARLLYQKSKRADQPFLVLSCATLHPERLEVELFGSVGGNGEEPKKGVLEQANGGTLFLDEVADMPLETQGKIVRVLQEQRFQKIGGEKMIETDVRIIASTNRDLEKMIEKGTFRQDLYYRLNVVPIHIEPLRKRPQDVPALVNHFIKILSKASGLPIKEFLKPALSLLQSYNWPGNVRQLKNVVEWVLIMNSTHEQREIGVADLPPEIAGQNKALMASAEDSQGAGVAYTELPLREAREMFEREYLETQVDRFEGNISKTAEFVGMERSALHRKLKSLKETEDNKQTEEAKKRA